MKIDNHSFEIKIVFDELCSEPGYLKGFGFSALIHNLSTDTYLLFDTGGSANTLISNIQQLSVPLSSISKIIISHDHYDHAGGIIGIYRKNESIEIYVPQHTYNAFKSKFPKAYIYGVSDLIEIEECIFISGQFKEIFTTEQFMMLKLKDNSLILLVGCAHPGLENFILKAQEIGKIKGIIGGFHRFDKLSLLEDIEFIGACHCTRYIGTIRNRFPEAYKKICVGNSFRF